MYLKRPQKPQKRCRHWAKKRIRSWGRRFFISLKDCGTIVNLTHWAPNIADLSRDYRVCAIDVAGQPSKSIPDPLKEIGWHG